MDNQSIILGDCLDILKDIDNNSIDLIYVDPPFYTGKEFFGISKDMCKKYHFSDSWESQENYIRFIKDRILLCFSVLKDTGSIFVHCDRNATHLIRKILDEIFGSSNFQSEIIWYYKRWSNSKKGLLNQHQCILFYSKSRKFKWNHRFVEYSATTNIDQILQKRKRNKQGISTYATDREGNIIYDGNKKGVPLGDVWEIPFLNPKAKERTGYPTQKPIVLLEKIIDLVTDENDIVLDPFCGSGTTLVAAKLLNRRFIGIDISEEAVELSKERLKNLIKTESILLNKGINAYINDEPWVTKHLAPLNTTKVQRNSGLDALLKTNNEQSIFLRVQRENESLEEAYKKMEKSIQSKPNSLGILIQTKTCIDEFSINKRISIVKSLELQIG